MDSFIYALVLVPALRELLPKSGIRATGANVGFYGGLLFALFLVGWGMALIWGPVADRFGRVRTLALTILCYSLFTLLAAFGQNVWEVAVFRLLAGVGIGGEWAMGGTFVAEEWPEEPPQDGRRPDAHRLLLRIFSRGARQSFRRRNARLAADVRDRRHPRAPDRIRDVQP